jgi:hypothetical protein
MTTVQSEGQIQDPKKEGNMQVQRIELDTELEKRVGFATVKIGEVSIRGVTVWRTPAGRLRVYFPSYRRSAGFREAIELSPELRAELEADVISAYKSAKSEA